MRVRRTREEWLGLYHLYLASPQWKQKRQLVLQRANYLCESCLTNRATEVHHLIYPQRRDGALTADDFEQQPAWQLRAVCRACHQVETEKRS